MSCHASHQLTSEGINFGSFSCHCQSSGNCSAYRKRVLHSTLLSRLFPTFSILSYFTVLLFSVSSLAFPPHPKLVLPVAPLLVVVQFPKLISTSLSFCQHFSTFCLIISFLACCYRGSPCYEGRFGLIFLDDIYIYICSISSAVH